MSSTTLMTFLVQAPRSVSTVSLLGSWDSFRKPYPMERDCRMGRGQWRGCHSFTDIICDGDCVQADGGRSGGLKMGGTYWYYYELNGSLEYHDPAEPSTRLCPFLPGQVVNVLEVPVQIPDHHACGPSASTSSLVSTYHYTLNPEDKYLNPVPPIPLVAHHDKTSAASANDLPEDIRLERIKPVVLETVLEVEPAEVSSRRASSSCDDLSLHDGARSYPISEPTSRPSSIWETLGELRGVSSAGRACLIEFDFGFERPTTSAGCQPELTRCVSLLSLSGRPISAPHGPVCERATVDGDSSHVYTPTEVPREIPEVEECLSTSGPAPELLRVVKKSRPSRIQVNDLASQFSLKLVGGNLADSAPPDRMNTEVLFHHSEPEDRFDNNGGLPDDGTGPARERNHHRSSVYSSVRSSQIVSPSLTFSTALTGYMSPVHLGQPSTPMIDEFEESFSNLKRDSFLTRCNEQPEDETATPHANHRGFPGYTLPEVKYQSALTVHNLQATTPKDSPSTDKSRHDLVSSWNDGSATQETGLEEFLDELGYLGMAIV